MSLEWDPLKHAMPPPPPPAPVLRMLGQCQSESSGEKKLDFLPFLANDGERVTSEQKQSLFCSPFGTQPIPGTRKMDFCIDQNMEVELFQAFCTCLNHIIMAHTLLILRGVGKLTCSCTITCPTRTGCSSPAPESDAKLSLRLTTMGLSLSLKPVSFCTEKKHLRTFHSCLCLSQLSNNQ